MNSLKTPINALVIKYAHRGLDCFCTAVCDFFINYLGLNDIDVTKAPLKHLVPSILKKT